MNKGDSGGGGGLIPMSFFSDFLLLLLVDINFTKSHVGCDGPNVERIEVMPHLFLDGAWKQ